MSEIIKITAEKTYDWDGNLIEGSGERTLVGIVQKTGQESINGFDIPAGEATDVVVFLPAGTQIEEGETLLIRDEEYVVETSSWDWNVGRNPANRLHKPKVQVNARRVEA